MATSGRGVRGGGHVPLMPTPGSGTVMFSCIIFNSEID